MKNPAVAALLACLPLAVACSAQAEPAPSIVLIVIDTLRADAVSSYGEVAGTTPELDALASSGLRYERAYAPAPWTLPSHATILSGLEVEQHRVGTSTRNVLPEQVVTLAERLSAAGYDTAAFSENSIVSDLFGLVQGFGFHRESRVSEGNLLPILIDGARSVDEWLAKRADAKKPFFLFVNLADPHDPYLIREQNLFVPRDAPRDLVQTRPKRPSRLLCGAVPDPQMLGVLRGLYLGEVHASDTKVGQIVRATQKAAGAGRPPIVVVVSDHGEYLGEDRLMGHEFGLHEVVLRVPLIVNGLRGVAPAVIPDTVGLVDLAPTILGWAGLAVPSELRGKPLPQRSGGKPGDRTLFAYYSDATHWTPLAWKDHGIGADDPDHTRAFCAPSDPVWGAMAAVIRYPYKFVWYEKSKPALYDLSWDRAQKSNQAAYQKDSVARFEKELPPRLRAAGLTGEAKAAPSISKEAADALRALGYAD
jgi:arylsulfatase A-like enzyme